MLGGFGLWFEVLVSALGFWVWGFGLGFWSFASCLLLWSSVWGLGLWPYICYFGTLVCGLRFCSLVLVWALAFALVFGGIPREEPQGGSCFGLSWFCFLKC